MVENKFYIRGDIYLEKINEHNERISFQNINNLIVDDGLGACADLVGNSGTSFASSDDVAVGDGVGAPGASDRQLQGEVDRQAGTWTSQSDGVFDISASFTGNTFTASECALFDDATSGSDNYMLGRATYSPETLSSGDTLNVIYTVSFAAA